MRQPTDTDTDETDGLMPGERLADVRLGQLIGTGASSEVYAADSLTVGRPCAVKVFRRELGIGSVSRGRYAHIAHEVGHLDHPAIADVYSFGETPDGRSFAVCDLAPGQSLGQLISKHAPLPRKIAIQILRQICNALAVSHAHGLAHLRLHRGNVMVDVGAHEIDKVVLLDFGVCQLYPPLNEIPASFALGPQHAIWIAPEQARGEAGDSRTDVYAVTVLLYEMLCGHVPFLGSTFKETLEMQISAPPPSPALLAAMPLELEQTILRGLEKDPRRRTPSVEALLSAIDPISVATGQHQALARTQPPRQRTLSTGEFKPAEQTVPGAQETAPPPVEPVTRSIWSKRHTWLLVGLAIAALIFTTIVWLI